MTIATILNELHAQHGNAWPEHAYAAAIGLTVRLAIGDYTDEDLQRYALLRAWILSTLAAGITARQTSAL